MAFHKNKFFSVQFEKQGGDDPRKMAFRFGSGENSNAASEMRTWYTTNEVIPSKGQGSPWTHFVVATDGWAGPGPRIWVNGVSQSILLTNAGSSVGSYDGLMTTAGGGKFLLGGGAYTHKNTNAYGDDNDNFYIDDFAMWQGTSTASLTTAMIDELYHSGQYVNLNKTSGGLGTPFMYYTFDDLADPQSGFNGFAANRANQRPVRKRKRFEIQLWRTCRQCHNDHGIYIWNALYNFKI